MIEILKSAGFQYKGDCMKCGNRYEDWEKSVNGKVAKVKMKKDGKKFQLLYKGQTWWGVLSQASPDVPQVLTNVLTEQGLM